MRVAILGTTRSDFTEPQGGVEIATHLLATGLIQLGVDCLLLAPGSAEKATVWYGVPVKVVPREERLSLVRGMKPWDNAVHDALRDFGPHVVHAQGLLGAASAAVGWHGSPRVVTAHGNPIRDRFDNRPRVSELVRCLLAGARAAHPLLTADLVIQITSPWYVNCPVPPRRVIHVPNAIRPQFFDVLRRPRRHEVACFADARRIKGLDILTRSWPTVLGTCPSAMLRLYGSIGDPIAERLVLDLPATVRDTVSLLPPATGEDLSNAFATAHVVVLPSRYEVSPLVAGEAMAAGVPIVATDVGGTRRMTGGAARMCEPSPIGLAQALTAVLGGSEDEPAMIAKGKYLARAFRAELVAKRHVALYEHLIATGQCWRHRPRGRTTLRTERLAARPRL